MLKKIRSSHIAFHKTLGPAVRYNLFLFCCLRHSKATKSKKDFHSHRGYIRSVVFQLTFLLACNVLSFLILYLFIQAQKKLLIHDVRLK